MRYTCIIYFIIIGRFLFLTNSSHLNNIQNNKTKCCNDDSSRLFLQNNNLTDLLLNYINASINNNNNSNSSSNCLEFLDLSNYDVKIIKNSPFRTLSVLKVLKISNNSVETIESDAFIGLVALQQLDLSHNKLKRLEAKWFEPLESLRSLNLSSNNLEIVENFHFKSLKKLEQLDLSWNEIIHLEPGNIEFPNLLQLILTGNSLIGGAYELYIGPGKVLQNVDVSHSSLIRVPSALTQTIRIFRLRRNKLKTISRGDFDSYPLIQVLDLSYNSLENVEEDALGRLDLLKILYLTSNKLIHVPYSLPVTLNSLFLGHNDIKTIHNNDFLGLVVLEVLKLNDNKIESIEKTAFSSLKNIYLLDISNNPLIRIPFVLLSNMPQLQVLRLSNLNNASFEPDSIISFISDRLTNLDVSKSPKLAQNFLNNTAFLLSAREIQEINLQGTGIVRVRSDLFFYFSQLRTLNLQDNPLNCTGLEWLATWLRRQESAQNQMIKCDTPIELKNIPLIDLLENKYFSRYYDQKNSLSKVTRKLYDDKVLKDRKLGNSTEASKLLKTNNSESGQLLKTEYAALIVILFCFVNLAVILLIFKYRTYFCNKRNAHNEEMEVINLPGVIDLW